MSAKKSERKFEEILSELEGIVQDLEGGQVGLDEALEKYEKGIAALKACYERLTAAEKKIEILTKNPDGTFRTKPFEEGVRDEGSGERSEGKSPQAKKRSRDRVPKPAEKEDPPTKGGDEETLF